MAVKILGSAIIMAASVGFGFYLSGRDTYRCCELMQMKKALNILVSEIRFSNALSEAAINVSDRVNGAVSHLFAAFGASLAQRAQGTVLEFWENSITAVKARSYFTDDDFEMFLNLGKTFGYLDKQMQIDAICLVIGQIDGEYALLSQKRDQNKKLYLNLGALGGLAVVITLL
ncbi:MAG: stage III sporulation protein AB [Clostridiales bacterium]|jgi:stage III sporulation protein AB|nr:stage III sporulation protein AB [Clostridiales bacterium]